MAMIDDNDGRDGGHGCDSHSDGDGVDDSGIDCSGGDSAVDGDGIGNNNEDCGSDDGSGGDEAYDE